MNTKAVKDDFDVKAFFGPGTWYTLTVNALVANTKTEQDTFIAIILRPTIVMLFCSKCSKEANAYFDMYPPENFVRSTINDIKPIFAMFKYLFDFHNFVNLRLGKEVKDFKECFDYYRSKVIKLKLISDNPTIPQVLNRNIPSRVINTTEMPRYEQDKGVSKRYAEYASDTRSNSNNSNYNSKTRANNISNNEYSKEQARSEHSKSRAYENKEQKRPYIAFRV